jgi:hypothetical protein
LGKYKRRNQIWLRGSRNHDDFDFEEKSVWYVYTDYWKQMWYDIVQGDSINDPSLQIKERNAGTYVNVSKHPKYLLFKPDTYEPEITKFYFK